MYVCVLPVFGKEENRGNVIHHELPWKVITCNIHPTQRKCGYTSYVGTKN